MKLDKSKKDDDAKKGFLEEPDKSPLHADIDSDEDDDDFDLAGFFDDEDDDDDESDEGEGIDEEEDEEDFDFDFAKKLQDEEDDSGSDDESDEGEGIDEEEDEEPESKPKKGRKKLSKAEIKLIELKKENKELQQKQKELSEKLRKQSEEDEVERLKQDYLAENYDDFHAEKFARDDIRLRKIEERQAELDFREDNFELFEKYPQARKDVKRIMSNSSSTGMTPEQVCRGLYGEPKGKSEFQKRAIQSAQGQVAPKTKAGSSRPASTGGASKEVTLTPAQRREKANIERLFFRGQKISVEEYLAAQKK